MMTEMILMGAESKADAKLTLRPLFFRLQQ